MFTKTEKLNDEQLRKTNVAETFHKLFKCFNKKKKNIFKAVCS